jgi:hypothetical protein
VHRYHRGDLISDERPRFVVVVYDIGAVSLTAVLEYLLYTRRESSRRTLELDVL